MTYITRKVNKILVGKKVKSYHQKHQLKGEVVSYRNDTQLDKGVYYSTDGVRRPDFVEYFGMVKVYTYLF